MILTLQVVLLVAYVLTLFVSLIFGVQDLQIRVHRTLHPSKFTRRERRTMQMLRFSEESPLPRHWVDAHTMLDSLSDRGEKWVITAAAFLGVVGGAATTSAVGMLIPDATELWIVSGTITTVAMFLALYVLLTKLRRLTEPIGTVSVMGRRLIMSAMRFEAIDSMANHQRFTATSRIFLAWAQKIGLDTSNSSLRRISLNVDDEFRHPKVAEASIHHVQELLTQLHSGAHAAVIAKARRPETWPAGAINGRAVSRGFVALAPAVVAVIGLFVR